MAYQQPYNPQQTQFQGAPPGYGLTPMVPARPSSAAAVWALVLGLVGFFAGWCLLGVPCLAAVIAGHVALSDTKDGVKSGRGMAVAGLALGYVTLAPAIILFFWLIVGGFGAAATPAVTPTSP